MVADINTGTQHSLVHRGDQLMCESKMNLPSKDHSPLLSRQSYAQNFSMKLNVLNGCTTGSSRKCG